MLQDEVAPMVNMWCNFAFYIAVTIMSYMATMCPMGRALESAGPRDESGKFG